MTNQPAKIHRFSRSSYINTSLDDIKRFHSDPRALARLTPPPLFMKLHRDERRSLTEGEIEFSLWLGPIPIRWLARHEPGPSAHSFADSQLRGPLQFWRHEHVFSPVEGGVELTDRVTYAHKRGFVGWLTRIAFGGWSLRILFAYRHWRTRRALASV